MSTYDQIMSYYADDEEFQKRAQTRWKYFEREGYRKLSDILPVDDYADKVEKYALYYYLAKEIGTLFLIISTNEKQKLKIKNMLYMMK